MALAYASLSPNISDRIQPLLPALKSNWLIAHVMTSFLGYAAFAIAFGVSIMFIFKQRAAGGNSGLLDRLPDAGVLDELTHQLVMFGFLFLTAGIITGAVWANSAWGRYWGWDPKETWALVTILVYTFIGHMHKIPGFRGNFAISTAALLGISSVLMTYFGVNYYLSGLHSYASGEPAPIPTGVYIAVIVVFIVIAGAFISEKNMKPEPEKES